jgi:hypothetical protein
MFIGIGPAFPARDIPGCLINLFLKKLRTMIQLFEKYVNKFILIKFYGTASNRDLIIDTYPLN